MSLDRLVLVLFCIVTVIGAAIWLMTIIFVSASLHPALAVVPLSVAGLLAYIIIRVVLDRTNSAEDDHYDKMEH